MASLVLSGDTSGSITVSAPAISGSNTQTLVATTGTLAPIVSGTAVASTSGTAINFDNAIPTWAKRVTVMFQGVSTNGTGIIQVQLGTGSTPTYTITGYLGSGTSVSSGVGAALYTTGFGFGNSRSAATVSHGIFILTNLTSNTWSGSGSIGRSDAAVIDYSAGSIALGAALTSVRVIGSATGSPSDTFDAGTINILYE
jgi:hypothetical protein